MSTRDANPYQYKSVNDIKVAVKAVEMDEQMKNRAIQVGRECVFKLLAEKTLAGEIKHAFQNDYGGSWHCVVGRIYSSALTHDHSHYIYMYVGHEAILLFKTP